MKKKAAPISRDGETNEVLVPSETQESSWDSLSVKHHPVDTGWAWVIMIGVFVIHFLTTGYLRSFGLLYVEFQDHFHSSSTMTAAMNGVQMLSYSLGTFITMNVLMKYISVKTSCLAGCCLELISVISNTFVTNIRYLLLTHGLLFGCGQALIYCPSMVILSEYFDKKRPIATVLATGGVSAGGVIMPLLIRHLLDSYGLMGGLLILGAVIFQQAVFVSLFTSPSDYTPAKSLSDTNNSCESLHKAAKIDVPSACEQKYDLSVHCEYDKGAIETRDNSSKELETKASKDANMLHTSTNHVQKGTRSINSSHFDDVSVFYSQPLLSVSETSTLGDQNRLDKTIARQSIISTQVEKTKDESTSLRPKSYSIDAEHDQYTPQSSTQTTNTTTDQPLSNAELLIPNNRPHAFLINNKTPGGKFLTRQEYILPGYLREQSCPEQGKTDQSRSPRSSLHPMAFQSDTLARAMSTSSIDVLGSAQRLSVAGSTLSVRHRGTRGLSLERNSDSKRNSKPLSPRSRLKPRLLCRVPDVARTPAFWLLTVFFSGGGVASVLPTVFLPPLAKSQGLSESQSSFFLVVSAVMEMLGRLIPGLILHLGYMRPSTVVIPSMTLCGVLLQLVTFFRDFQSLMILSCLVGLFTGSFWAMQVLVVIEVIGIETLGQAFCFYSIILGFSVGSGFPLAGALVDATGAYIVPYHFFGALYLLAATGMVLIQFTKRAGNLDGSLPEDDYDDDNDED